MSHELRTPLNAIIGFSEALELFASSTNDGTRSVEYAGYIREAGQHLLTIINDLLDVARTELHDVDPQPETIAFAFAVDRVLLLLDQAMDARKIVFHREIAGEASVFADPRMLKQLLVNLIGNAVKFSPPGGAIAVTATNGREGDLTFTIEDDGPGIATADRERVFEPFWQKADSQTRDTGGGVGLGLSIVRAIVQAHHGSISIDDNPAGGARVTVWLPGRVAGA